MMIRFLAEAFVVGAKEGAAVAVGTVLAFVFFGKTRRDTLRLPLIGGIAAALLSTAAIAAVPVDTRTREILVRLIGYVFGLFYLFSFGALFAVSSERALPLSWDSRLPRLLSPLLVFLLTVVYCIPDMAGTALFVKDLYATAGRGALVPVLSAAGFAAGGALVLAAGARFRTGIARTLDLPQFFLFLALIKLVGGGVHGFAELSLIPSVQAGLMKLIHDVVHQLLTLLLVPDHPLLTMTAWRSINVLFGDTLALWLSLAVMIMPLLLFLRRHFGEGISVPAGVPAGARRRRFIRSVRDDRLWKSLPVFAILIVIAGTWFSERGERLVPLYDPAPVPVTAEGPSVVIPLRTPTEDLMDGALHKYAVTLRGGAVRFFVVKRKNGTLAVCLDACEVCPPEGYGQEGDRVLCLYCRTPIPSDTLGSPGGCNPIPLRAQVTDREVRIDVAELGDAWAKTTSDRKAVVRP